MKRRVMMLLVMLIVLAARRGVTQTASASPSAKAAIDSLSATDLQQAITALRSNFITPDLLTDQEISRATLQGLIARLGRGSVVLTQSEAPGAATGVQAYSEVLDNHIGYLRIGSFTNTNLQAVDKFLASFATKKVDAVIIDLRVDSQSSDFSTAAEFAKRFTPKGKELFSIRKPAARQDRTFTSERDPAYQGTMMILADEETAGAGEAMAGAIRLYSKALVVGSTTAGRAVEYSEVPLSGGKTLRVASGEVILPDGRPLFPEGVKADVAVEMSAVDKRQIFQASAQKGMAGFVYEAERPHLNEAALIAGTNPELDEMAQRRSRAREALPLRDPVLQRAVDVVTSLAVYQKR